MEPEIARMKCDLEGMNQPRSNRGSVSTVCPRCGQPGRPVSEVTVQSLVTERAQARLKSLIGFRFCATPNCEVAYSHQLSGETVLQGELRAVIFQKSADPRRLVCYCFGHTAGAVQSEVRATRVSSILEEIKAKCAQGLDACERNNPRGSCCLGNVQRLIREAGYGPAPHGCCCKGE